MKHLCRWRNVVKWTKKHNLCIVFTFGRYATEIPGTGIFGPEFRGVLVLMSGRPKTSPIFDSTYPSPCSNISKRCHIKTGRLDTLASTYSDEATGCTPDQSWFDAWQGLDILFSTAMVFNLFCSRTPRYNFSSTLYPQRCWCVIQVIHSLYNLCLK
jgi:hypothetical protein